MIKILVVEDDPMVAKLHDVYINQLDDFQLVDSVRNSDEALKFLAKKSVDLVLLDIFMPNIDGLQLLKEIRTRNYDIDVICISAATDKEHILTALRYGAFDYIIKPFEFERFSIALNSYRQRNIMLNSSAVISQEDLDSCLLNKAKTPAGTIPKGLEQTTLYNVWQEIITIDGSFTTEEIASKIGISRVSIRKYLEFLKSINILHLELNRGCVGRPVYRYKCVNKNATILNSYVKSKK